jgi:rhamnulokinase
MQEQARIAIDLGAESCRVSLLRWINGQPKIEVIHRIPNGPVHRGDTMRWPLETILAGLGEGLRKAAAAAPEGIASIAADSWGVDYVRLAPDGKPLAEPFCYRDERTVATKEMADKLVGPLELFQRTGALPHRINTIYQLLADPELGFAAGAPWVMMPEYVLSWLGAPRVSEFTHATHTGLVDLRTGGWDSDLFKRLGLSIEAAPPLVRTGTVLGPLKGPLAELPAFRATQLIVPACHDTASAIAAIPFSMASSVYISSGTWSLVGTLAEAPVTTREAFNAGYTNLGAATGDFLLHSLVNSMWILKQCMDGWAAEGRGWGIEELIEKATACETSGTLNMDAEALLLDSKMPERINTELAQSGQSTIADVAGNEPLFARLIFDSLARRYALSIGSLEQMLGRKMKSIHLLGGASRNKLLVDLTEKHTGLPVHIGHAESTTIGNFAVQLAAAESNGASVGPGAIRKWAGICGATDTSAPLP